MMRVRWFNVMSVAAVLVCCRIVIAEPQSDVPARSVDRFQHDHPVFTLVFSPDGKWLVAGEYDRRDSRKLEEKDKSHSLHVWDVASKKKLHSFRANEGQINSLAFSPDGKMIASAGGNGDLEFWDVIAGKKVAPFRRPLAGKTCVTFSRDGKHLAYVSSSDARIVQVADGEEICRIEGSDDVSICELVLSPDGRYVACVGGTDSEVHLWDFATGKQVQRFQWDSEGNFIALNFFPDGRTLAASGNGPGVMLWDVRTGQPRLSIGSFHSGCLAIAPDGRVLAAVRDEKNIFLFDTSDGSNLGLVGSHRGEVHAIVFSPDGKSLATSSEDGSVVVWELGNFLDRMKLQQTRLTPRECADLWSQLKDDDAKIMHRAVTILSKAPAQSIPFLQERLSPVPLPKLPEEKVERFLRELDDDDFSVREAGTKALLGLGRPVAERLRKALQKGESLEANLRINKILVQVEELTKEEMQAVRAIEVLERIGSQEARQVLEPLAKGYSEAPLTQEAQKSLRDCPIR